MATNSNMNGSYYLSKSHMCHITSSLLQNVLKISTSSTDKRVDTAVTR